MKDRGRGSEVPRGRELRGRVAGGLERKGAAWRPGLAVTTSSVAHPSFTQRPFALGDDIRGA